MDQAVVLRKLTGEVRLLQALSLSDLVRSFAKRGARKKTVKRTLLNQLKTSRYELL